jgi:hypothetical protein
MNNAWIREQDRKRSLVAAASTACLYALAFTGAWAIGLLAPMSLASVPSTVIVDLGGKDGPAGQVPLGLPNAPDRPAGEPAGAAPPPEAGSEPPLAPAAASAQETPDATISKLTPIPAAPAKAAAKTAPPKAPKAAAKASPQAARPVAKTIPEKSAAEEAAEAAAQAAAQIRAAEETAALRAAEATAQAAAGPPKTRTFGSSSSSGKGGAPVTSSGTGSSPGVAGGTGTATFRGSEMGNAHVTTFGASTGQVGRNLFIPVYLYMPLPMKIEESINRNIKFKDTFGKHYDTSGPVWQLKSQVPLAERDNYWTTLEQAGYDASTADYRTGRKLSPVVLEFAVGPLTKNRVELVDVRLQSSSGSPEIDEAVIYGFKQASFFNKTGYAVGGKFVYEF